METTGVKTLVCGIAKLENDFGKSFAKGKDMKLAKK